MLRVLEKWSILRAATRCSLRQEGPRKLKHSPNGQRTVNERSTSGQRAVNETVNERVLLPRGH